ncbi:histidine phosphatase family protein [sulfur-oxidizing endosymbiont of Gigantopelta aegis]|uniref:histidine phosphatase family protein n=1 Tax=sulfur-oxidizing endosymbiont of Gigantopelta aegis TaxID=2794934 RepID=UPI001BE4956C|nr:alpha-ribazole phosphatase family protein [sulfur-oxidizing endosymbiont of Gigantopelta aegis]
MPDEQSYKKSTIIVLRHGEPDGSNYADKKIFRGITDDVLTKKGWQQMANAIATIENTIDVILTSPLKRCAEFALSVATQHNITMHHIDAFQEIDFGQWEGRSVQDVECEASDNLKRFWQNPLHYTPPDGEPVADFQQRVVARWQESIKSYQDKTVLLIAHGGVQKIILAEVLNMPVQAIHNIEVPYACCSIFHIYYNDGEIISTLKSHGRLA